MAQQIIITKDNYGIELECYFVDAKKKVLDITGLLIVMDLTTKKSILNFLVTHMVL